VKRVPLALVVLRAACGPALVAGAVTRCRPWILVGLVTAAFISDVFDGIIARRVGVATERLRRADTIVDTAFYICATLALLVRAPAVIEAHNVGVAILVGLELARWLVERIRYGRLASYHMWSAKAWGIALWLGFSEAFLTGQPGPFIQAAVAMGILADVEGLVASVVLSTWQHDVPTVWHAVQLERAWRTRHAPEK
jgi:CDP-diacylglycerol--glycerol-3-phosphate 3-phosphatidyltransferase